MKKVAFFDIDGTVFTDTWTCEVTKALVQRLNFSEQQAKIDKTTCIAKARGSTESYWVYNSTMLKVFDEILPQISPDVLSEVVQEVLSDKGSSCYAYSIALIEKMKSEGRELIAISGSIKDVVEPFAQSLGFNIIIASELEIIAGHYTGKRVNQTIKDKDALLRTIVAEHHLTLEDSLGIGDTHRDISILEMLEHPIAFNPNAALYDHAAQQGWKIVIERKNMIYELSKKRDVYELESAHPIHDDANKEYVR